MINSQLMDRINIVQVAATVPGCKFLQEGGFISLYLEGQVDYLLIISKLLKPHCIMHVSLVSKRRKLNNCALKCL